MVAVLAPKSQVIIGLKGVKAGQIGPNWAKSVENE